MNLVRKARSHTENRKVLCGVCYKKGDLRPITDNQLSQLKTLVDRSYCLDNVRYQTVLCKVCALALSAHVKKPDNPGRTLLKPKYENLNPPPSHSTRSVDPQSCPCTMCEIARSNLTAGSFSGHRLPEKFWKILFPDSQYPTPKYKKENIPPVENRCSKCFSKVGQGLLHACSRTNMENNLQDIVQQSSLISQEKIGSKILKNIFEEKEISTNGGTTEITTGNHCVFNLSFLKMFFHILLLFINMTKF